MWDAVSWFGGCITKLGNFGRLELAQFLSGFVELYFNRTLLILWNFWRCFGPSNFNFKQQQGINFWVQRTTFLSKFMGKFQLSPPGYLLALTTSPDALYPPPVVISFQLNMNKRFHIFYCCLHGFWLVHACVNFQNFWCLSVSVTSAYLWYFT